MKYFERNALPKPEHDREEFGSLGKFRLAISRLPGGEFVPDDALVAAASDVSRKAAGLAEKGAKNPERAARGALKPLLATLRRMPDLPETHGYDVFVDTAHSADSDAVRKAIYGRDIPPLRT